MKELRKRVLTALFACSLMALSSNYLTFFSRTPQMPQILLAKELEDKDSKQTIYLTVDDGPKKSIETLLEKCEEDDKITFFMIGKLLDTPNGFKLACKSLELGHEIGNHSYSHPRFSKINIEKVKEEILKTDELIDKVYRKVGRKNPKLFRFPYGDLGNKKDKKEIKSFLENQGYKIYFWDLDSEDWMHYSKKNKKNLDEIINIISKTKEGDIVLVHELPITIEKIIPFYTYSDKYNLKTLTNIK